jgi:hypothetical protein
VTCKGLLIALLRWGLDLFCIKHQTEKTFGSVSRKTCWCCGPNVAPFRAVALHQTTNQQNVMPVNKFETPFQPCFIDPDQGKLISLLIPRPAYIILSDIRDARQKARQLKAESQRLRLNKRLLTQGVVVHDPIRSQKGDQIMRHAYNKVGSEEAGFDKEQDEDTCDLFSIYFEHVHKNQDYFRTGKKTSGLRFDPLFCAFDSCKNITQYLE